MPRIEDYLVTVMTKLQHPLTMAQYRFRNIQMCSLKYNHELKSQHNVKVPVKYKLSSCEHSGAF